MRASGDALAAMAARRLPVPPDINVKLDNYSWRPLLVHVFYDLTYFLDPVPASIAPMLAKTFFALLGMNIQLERGAPQSTAFGNISHGLRATGNHC